MAREPSISEVIGRMLMVGVRGASIDDPAMKKDLEACHAAHVGGVILFDVDLSTYKQRVALGDNADDAKASSPRNVESPEQVRRLNTDLRNGLGSKLLVGVDQEGGRVNRLPAMRGFPLMPPASDYDAIGVEYSRDITDTLWRTVSDAGFNVNFAPCIDVAVNPENTVVVQNNRCFSADPLRVITFARQWLFIAEEFGVAACLKHFPGHGSSTGDTHQGFVEITHTFNSHVELEPYRALIADPEVRVPMVMTGHLYDANVDANHPASLSHAHTTRMLREQIGFDGVIVTDSLDMGAITTRYGPEEACVLAINAGADILLDANNPPEGWRECPAPMMHEAIMRALSKGQIVGGEERLRASWQRIERMMERLKRRA